MSWAKPLLASVKGLPITCGPTGSPELPSILLFVKDVALFAFSVFSHAKGFCLQLSGWSSNLSLAW